METAADDRDPVQVPGRDEGIVSRARGLLDGEHVVLQRRVAQLHDVTARGDVVRPGRRDAREHEVRSPGA